MTSLYLVDDHKLFLSGVLAEMGTDFDVAGSAAQVDEAVEGIRRTEPDVVLIDVHMSGGGGVRVVSEVLSTNPDVQFLALSVSDAPEDVIAMIRAGARGYVTKSIAPADLIDSVRRVAEGDAVFSPRLAGFVLDAFGKRMPAPVDPELDMLTPREQEVLRHIARGFAYKQVARKLGISIKTVETHVSAVLRKLQLSSRHELAVWPRTEISCERRHPQSRKLTDSRTLTKISLPGGVTYRRSVSTAADTRHWPARKRRPLQD